MVGIVFVAVSNDIGQGFIDGEGEVATGDVIETDTGGEFLHHRAYGSEKFGATENTSFEMGSGEIGFHKVKRSWDRLRRKKREEWMCNSQGGRWQNDGSGARRGANRVDWLGGGGD